MLLVLMCEATKKRSYALLLVFFLTNPIINSNNDKDINIKTKKLISSFHLKIIRGTSKTTPKMIGQIINKLFLPLNIRSNKYVKTPTKAKDAIPSNTWNKTYSSTLEWYITGIAIEKQTR